MAGAGLSDTGQGTHLFSGLGHDRPPIIIGGCGRSGTSLLLAVLSAHPAIQAVPHESEAFCPTAWSDRLDRAAAFEPNRVIDWLKSEGRPPAARRWLEKSPKNILFFGRILDYFGGEVRLVNLVRDGRDVVTSYHPTRRRERPWVGPERWVNDVSAGVPFDQHPLVHLVRYEDLVQDFEVTLRRLCRFLDEDFDDRLLDWRRFATVKRHPAWPGEVEGLHDKSVGKWRRPENKPFVEALLALPEARWLLNHYGYR